MIVKEILMESGVHTKTVHTKTVEDPPMAIFDTPFYQNR